MIEPRRSAQTHPGLCYLHIDKRSNRARELQATMAVVKHRKTFLVGVKKVISR